MKRNDSYASEHSDQTPVPGQHFPTLAGLFELALVTDADVRFNIEITTCTNLAAEQFGGCAIDTVPSS